MKTIAKILMWIDWNINHSIIEEHFFNDTNIPEWKFKLWQNTCNKFCAFSVDFFYKYGEE